MQWSTLIDVGHARLRVSHQKGRVHRFMANLLQKPQKTFFRKVTKQTLSHKNMLTML